MVLPEYSFHLFAGAGGGILGDQLLGGIPVGAVEIEEFPREVLFARQRDGLLPRFPIWDDICSFTEKNPECAPFIQELRRISGNLVISGGFPCQDISIAGRGEGLDGERSGLWSQMWRVVREVRPRFVYVENSPFLTSRGLGAVLGNLAEIGYDAEWDVLGADEIGGSIERKRIWILARTNEVNGRERLDFHEEQQKKILERSNRKRFINWPDPKAGSTGKVDSFSSGVDRREAVGNAQVPGVAAVSFLRLITRGGS